MKNTKLRVVSLIMVLVAVLLCIFTGCSESKESEESEGGLKTYQEYDEDGKLIKETHYYINSDLVHLVLDYNKNEKPIKASIYDYREPNEVVAYFMYEYDENQKLLKSTLYSTCDFDYYMDDAGGTNITGPIPTSPGVIIYDLEDGSLSLSEGGVKIHNSFRTISSGAMRYSSSAFCALEMSRKRVNEFDADGKITKFTFYDENDALVSYTEFKYNEDGNPVKVTRYNKDGKPETISTYSGQSDEETTLPGEGVITVPVPEGVITVPSEGEITLPRVKVHNQKPINVVKFLFNDDGTVRFSQERNEEGVVIKETYYNADGTVKSYTNHEYDEYGVIIRKSEFNADGTVRNYCVYDNVYAYRGEELIGYESVTMTKYNADNTVDHYVVYEYDENSYYPLHPISEIVYKADGKVDSYAEYSDEDQNWSNGGERKTVYDAGRDMLYYVITQDDSYEHIKTETKYSPDGSVIEVIKTIY